jgi:hypothetical protein
MLALAMLGSFGIALAEPDARPPDPAIDAGVAPTNDAGPPAPTGGTGSAAPRSDAGSAAPRTGSAAPRSDAGSAAPRSDAGSAAPRGDAGSAADVVPEVVDAGVPDAASESEIVDAGVVVASVVDAGVPRDAASAIVGEPPPAPMTPPTTATTTETTVFAIKVIGGLIALLVLAYLGAHRRVVRFQEQLGIQGVITAGFPFIALGLVAGLEPVGILTGQVLENLGPVMHFGLGWLGFIIGAQLDIRVLERVPTGTGYLIVVEALGPFLVVGAGCGALMLGFGSSWRDPIVWRDGAS